MVLRTCILLGLWLIVGSVFVFAQEKAERERNGRPSSFPKGKGPAVLFPFQGRKW